MITALNPASMSMKYIQEQLETNKKRPYQTGKGRGQINTSNTLAVS
jgi:hypothetical protein